MTTVKNMAENLPVLLKGNKFWEDVLNSIQQEIQLTYEHNDKSKYYLYPYEEDDIQVLIDTAKDYGFEINVEVKDDLEYVQQYFKSISYLIKRKGIRKLFLYTFKLVERIGDIYLMAYQNGALFKIINFDETINNLPISYSEPFEFVTEQDFGVYFDSAFQFDSDPLSYFDTDDFQFDQNSERPTQNLAIEFKIGEDTPVLIDGENFLIDSNYFSFMKDIVFNFKKLTTVPMVGTDLVLRSDVSAFYDSYSTEPSVDGKYHTKLLSLIDASATKYFRVRNFVEPFSFDTDTSGRGFDGVATWRFDLKADSGAVKDVYDRFHTIKLGIGSKGLLSNKFEGVEKDTILQLAMNRYDIVSNKILDESVNDYGVNVEGEAVIVDGYIGDAFYFDGSYLSVPSFNLSGVTDFSCGFWFKKELGGDVNQGLFGMEDNSILLHTTSISNEDFTLSLFIDGEEGFESDPVLNYGEQYFIYIVVEHGVKCTVFINNDKYEKPFAFSPVFTSSELQIGAYSTANLSFKTTIEEFRVYNRLLSEEEILFMYNSRYGSQASLAKPVFEKRLAEQEIHENENKVYSAVTTAIPVNKVVDRIVYSDASGEVGKTSYNLRFDNLAPKFCKLRYEDVGNNLVEFTDIEGDGNIYIDTTLIATVDYANGVVTLEAGFLLPMKQLSPIMFEYTVTDDSVQYTEAGIFDNEDRCVAYATFPKTKYLDLNNHFGVSWLFEDKELLL